MKAGLEQLPGKTINAIVSDQRHGRVFLVFSDDTHFEFYPGAGSVHWTRAVDRGGLDVVLGYVREGERDQSVAVFR
jgi:hypothetical protein